MQINLTGFLTKDTPEFMKSLWKLLLEAQEDVTGVPRTFVEQKKEEMRKARQNDTRAIDERDRRARLDEIRDSDRGGRGGRGGRGRGRGRGGRGGYDDSRGGGGAGDRARDSGWGNRGGGPGGVRWLVFFTCLKCSLVFIYYRIVAALHLHAVVLVPSHPGDLVLRPHDDIDHHHLFGDVRLLQMQVLDPLVLHLRYLSEELLQFPEGQPHRVDRLQGPLVPHPRHLSQESLQIPEGQPHRVDCPQGLLVLHHQHPNEVALLLLVGDGHGLLL